jgi:hypothetical protein
LLSAPALIGAARNPDKVNTASANPVLTTQQVIAPAVLGQHRTGTLLLLHVNDIHDFAYGVGEYRRNLKLAGLPTVCAGMEYMDNHESVFPLYQEFKIGAVRVAVIGGTANSSQPKSRRGRSNGALKQGLPWRRHRTG